MSSFPSRIDERRAIFFFFLKKGMRCGSERESESESESEREKTCDGIDKGLAWSSVIKKRQ